MSQEAAGSTFDEVQLEATLIALGYSSKLAREVAEARTADARYVAGKADRKRLRREPKQAE